MPFASVNWVTPVPAAAGGGGNAARAGRRPRAGTKRAGRMRINVFGTTLSWPVPRQGLKEPCVTLRSIVRRSFRTRQDVWNLPATTGVRGRPIGLARRRRLITDRRLGERSALRLAFEFRRLGPVVAGQPLPAEDAGAGDAQFAR